MAANFLPRASNLRENVYDSDRDGSYSVLVSNLGNDRPSLPPVHRTNLIRCGKGLSEGPLVFFVASYYFVLAVMGIEPRGALPLSYIPSPISFFILLSGLSC